MKKVIYSPTVGKPKSLFDDNQASRQEEGDYISTARLVANEESPIDNKQLEQYRTTISTLEEKNESLVQEKALLQKEYDELKQAILNEKKCAEALGYQEGMSRAQVKIDVQVDERVAAGEKILDKLKSEIVSAIYDQEGICLEIIYSAISRLIGESAGSKKQIREIVRLTMEKVASVDSLDVYVSAHDYENLQNDGFVTHNVIKSAEIEYGGCVIKSGKGSVTAKLDDQLVKLKEVLLDIHKAK